MTQKELLSLDNLKIAEVKEGYFLHVHTKDGYKLTAWKEGDDIKEYYASECIYAPIMDEYIDYRVITEDEDKALSDRKDEEVKKEMEQRLNPINK